MKADKWEYESKWYERGKSLVAGTDEAGRGPLAGPVVAAAVMFKPFTVIEGIDDSKKLTEKKRERLYGEITEKCICYSLYQVESDKIDSINILKASLLAMKESVYALATRPEVVLIDGKFEFDCDIETQTIIKGDSLSFSIAAASILAKVHRDKLMREYDKLYPEYGFASHKGYPTKAHYEAIKKHGVCPLHRLTYRLR